MAPHGVISLAERIPRATQRLYALFEPDILAPDQMERWRQAEEAIYADADDPLVNWDEQTLQAAFQKEGLKVSLQLETEESETLITPAMVQRWFTPSVSGRPAYVDRLAALLSSDEIAQIRELFERQLVGQVVPWRSRIAFVVARRANE